MKEETGFTNFKINSKEVIQENKRKKVKTKTKEEEKFNLNFILNETCENIEETVTTFQKTFQNQLGDALHKPKKNEQKLK